MCIDKYFQKECCTVYYWVAECLECLGEVSYNLRWRSGNEALTIYCKANKKKHAGFQCNYVHQEVPLVVCTNTVVNPWAMTFES